MLKILGYLALMLIAIPALVAVLAIRAYLWVSEKAKRLIS